MARSRSGPQHIPGPTENRGHCPLNKAGIPAKPCQYSCLDLNRPSSRAAPECLLSGIFSTYFPLRIPTRGNTMKTSDDLPCRETPARRRLLKILAGGSGAAVGMKTLPPQWLDPVVSSIVLPAHAQTSSLLFDPCSIDNISENVEPTFNIVVTISGAVGGGDNLGGIQIDIEGVLTESGTPAPSTAQNATVFTAADGTYGPVDLTFQEPCVDMSGPAIRDGVQVTITSPDPRLEGQDTICTGTFTKCDFFVQ